MLDHQHDNIVLIGTTDWDHFSDLLTASGEPHITELERRLAY